MRQTKGRAVLTIAGSDSSGGAGIQADIKVISATGAYAASVITALTAQNTMGVQSIQTIPSSFVMQQMESVFKDLDICAVKIGAVFNKEIIQVISAALQQFKPEFVILDPVMVAKNGCELLDGDSLECFKQQLIPRASLLTPNLVEAEKLLNIRICDECAQENAAKDLAHQFKINVLVKGGHFKGGDASDVVYLFEKNKSHWFHAKRINSKNTHGTGCSLSAAIASYLAQGYQLIAAIDAAKKYLTEAIESAKHWQLGRGVGPVDHFYFLERLKR